MIVICHFYYLFADENGQNVVICIETPRFYEYPKLKHCFYWMLFHCS